MAITLITEACNNGARKKRACEIVGLSLRALQRWQQANELIDQRTRVIKKPSNKWHPSYFGQSSLHFFRD